MRYCRDLGMYALDRPETSCKYATVWCKANCYNLKLYRLHKSMRPKDTANEAEWQGMIGSRLKALLLHKRRQTKRIRLMTRGEAFSNPDDILKVRDMLLCNSKVLIWIPTRAWRDPNMRQAIEQLIIPLRNARVIASIDPTNTDYELDSIKTWSTMYTGDDTATDGRYICPKTWQHKHGVCATCRQGCFNSKQVNVHLKVH